MKISRFVATLVALGVAGLVLAGPAVAATASPKARSARTASAKTAPATKINLNTATVEQLTTVPGVGKTLATRIVEHRQKEGAFRSVQELMNVKGVGEKNLAKIQGYFVVGDASRPAASK
jgi:competence protein ComEA